MPLRLALLALAVVAGAGGGCVTRGTHEAALAERDERIAALERERNMAQRSMEAYQAERDRVLEESEALRAEQARLEGERAHLEASVAARDEKLVSLRGTYDALVSDLETEVAAGQIQVEQLREGIRVNLTQEVLFPLGSAELSAHGADVIRRVASRLVGGAHSIDVRGHTDNLRIHGALADRYPSNWELAGARAASVVRLLQSEGVAPGLLRATSYGEFAPADSNHTAAGRARNRRIEIWLRPIATPEAGSREPAAGGAPGAGVSPPSAEGAPGAGVSPPSAEGAADAE